jgi:diguanylate cyclase (GGDEF)-like protein/PAS domain S-box-containing protein
MPDTPPITEARWSEARVFATILGVVFIADVAMMQFLPWLLPSAANLWVKSFVNGGLLTLVCAPILWRLIVDPLRTLVASERAKADVIVRTAADGILTFDADGRIASFNAAAEGIFGRAFEKAVGLPITDLLPLWQAEATEGRKYIGMEMAACRPDGMNTPVEVSVSHIDLMSGRLYTAIVHDISERKRIEEELLRAQKAREQAHRDLEVRVEYRTAELAQANQHLQHQSELFGNVLSSIPHLVYWKNQSSLFLGCNANFAAAVGLVGAHQIIGLTDDDFCWDESAADDFRRRDEDVMASGDPLLNVEEIRHLADGTFITALTSRVPMRDVDGQVIGLLGISSDITERKAVEAALQASGERLQSLVRNVSDIFAVLHVDGTVQYVSPAVETVLGHLSEDLSGRNFFDLVPSDDRMRAQQLFGEICIGGGDGLGEISLEHADGSSRVFEILGNNLLADPAIQGILVTCHDVTERKAFEGQLVHQAFHDALTGLPNRALFMDRLERAMTRAERQSTAVAVIFLDLDNFKIINDSLGHEAGDRLLMSVAERLPHCVRTVDTVARLGGDEFTVLLEDLTDTAEVAIVADRIITQLLAPLVLHDREVFTAVSLGIAISHGEYGAPDDLLRDADTAMYQAKTGGKGRMVTFDRSMNTHALERLELETGLRRALENNEFRLHYQPIISLEKGGVSGVEALVRWEHPRQGLIPPSKFIPLAEETGLIIGLGRWVLEEACRQAVRWQEESPETASWVISVNLSARQIQQENLVAEVSRVLRETGLDPERLKLEITESVMMSDSEATLGKLHALKALGVKLAVDDFGTGYSSMAYLSTLPIDTLKIDRSFVNKIGAHPESEAIVRTIVSLAKVLNLQVTSEGIETTEQQTYLQDLACDWGQGYLFAHPLTEGEVSKMLDKARDELTETQSRESALPVLDEPERLAA